MDEKPKAEPQLSGDALTERDYVSARWDARIPLGVKPEDLLKPAFWSHIAVKLKPWDELRARAEDGTWVGYYLVLDSSRTWAKVHQLSFNSLTTADVSLSAASESEVTAFKAAHKVTWRAGNKWSVVRNSDGAVLLENEQQKEVAIAWLEAHARGQVGVTAKPEPKEVPA